MTVANDLERYMLELVNEERTSRGLDALQLELNLNQSSDAHSAWMVDTNTFSHTGQGGSSATERMRDAGMDLSNGWRSAENLAAVSVSGSDSFFDEVARMHTNLMNSPGHRANILNPDLDYIGIGISLGPLTYSSGSTFASVLVTQNFASTGGTVDLDLLGTASADTLTGAEGDDHLQGAGGNDRLIGGQGDDTLRGDGGTDTAVLAVNLGNATVTAIDGGAKVVSSDGEDLLYGIENIAFSDGTRALSDLLAGDTTPEEPEGQDLNGSDGDNLLTGASTDDTISVGRGDDTINAMAGNDDVRGDGGNDTIRGGDGNDTLRGGQDSDVIIGGNGQDIIRGQRHADRIEGGNGNDNLNGGGGNDTIQGGAGDDFLKGGTRQDQLSGGDGNDNLVGNSFDDLLEGGAGNDTLRGGGENDTLDGGSGNDLLRGGTGEDVFIFDVGTDTDRITDFVAGEDILQITQALAGGTSPNFENLASLNGQDVIIDFGGGDQLVLDDLGTIDNLSDLFTIV